MFRVKHVSLPLYDEDLDKRIIIDQKQLQLDKNYGSNLFVICDKPGCSLSDRETFCIHDNIFYRIQSTHQDK